MAGSGAKRHPKVTKIVSRRHINVGEGNNRAQAPISNKKRWNRLFHLIGWILIWLLLGFVLVWITDTLFPSTYALAQDFDVSSLPSSSTKTSVSTPFILLEEPSGYGGDDDLVCVGLETSLFPEFLLGEKMGLLESRNLSIESLDDNLLQVFDEMLLRVGDNYTSGWFYISLGKDDYYTHLFQHEISGARRKYSGRAFTNILLKQMIRVVKNLYNANARKIVCMEIVPLGCSPIALWESYYSTATPTNNQTSAINLTYCAEDIDVLVLQYNAMLSAGPLELNDQVYQGIADYGFCSLMGEMRVGGGGRSGGVVGIWMCLS